jgi:nucleoid-associated protein YgaU
VVPVRNGSNPEVPDGGHSTQAGAVDDAAREVDDGDAVPLVVAAGVGVDDDPLPAVGAVNVSGTDVAAEGVVAAIAGTLAAPIVERFTAPVPVAAVCAAAGPARAIRSGNIKRNGWAIPVSNRA